MPRPAYVMFSQSGSVDKYTNRVTVTDVIEVIQVRRGPADGSQPPGHQSGRPYRLVAVWMKEEGDNPEDDFEQQVVCIDPNGNEFFASPVSQFRFATIFYRLESPRVDLPGFPELGVYVIEARRSRVGQQEWQARQSFPFVVQATPQPAPAATDPPAAPVA